MSSKPSQRARAISLALSLFLGASAAEAAPPVEAFAELPFISQPNLSPDGQRLAVMRAQDGRPIIAIYNLADPDAAPIGVPSSEWVFSGIRWVKNNRLLSFIQTGKRIPGDMLYTWSRAVALGADGENLSVMLKDNASLVYNLGVGLSDVALDDPDHIYMPFYNLSGSRIRYELQKVNVFTGKGTRTVSSTDGTIQWIMDGRGQVVARVDQDEKPLVEHIKVYEGGKWRDLNSYNAEAASGAHVLGLTEDGKALVRGASNGRTAVLTRLDMKSGKETLLYSHPKFDVSSTVRDDWTGRVIGASYTAHKTEYHYFDPKLQALQTGIEKAMPGLSVAIVSYSQDRRKVVFMAEGPRHPPSYFLLDRDTHHAEEISITYKGLQEADLGEMKPYDYKARDGLTIPAYITLPPGREAKNLPAVVMPHGGPDARDTLSFDWWAQFMANRGYVVLQPNFRGSEGYGQAFTEAGLQQWGLKMQDDITDGVRRMIADGIVDPKRVCIVGASYGGYAALAGASLTPDLYACAISVAGVSDLPRMIQHERRRSGRNSDAVSFWISRIGSPSDDSDRLRATSPARQAANVKCPVLLMHGEKDTTVPIVQSELMEDALDDEDKDVTFIRLEGDDHYLRLGETRLAMLKAIESFLAEHIGS